MKGLTILLTLLVALALPGISQPGPGNGLTLHRDLVYSKAGTTSLHLDLYLPDGTSLPTGVSVTGKGQEKRGTKKPASPAHPVIFWIPTAGTDKFPTPVTAFVGNGYAVVSLQAGQESSLLKNIGQAMEYLRENSARFNLETGSTGLIQQFSGGYRAIIWPKDMLQLKSVAAAEIQMKIDAASDPEFSILQSEKNSNALISFFDKHLRNGNHTESDPLALKCPKDSWVDPVTNPIPGTTYHLFSTPVRGINKQGSYLIYLPKDYATSGKRYPVIYWLHGGNGNSREGSWMCEQLDAAMKRGDMPPCLVVFVQGLPIGWYNNSKDGTMPVEDVIIKDLIPHIDATYRTISRREARGIDGMSMGGYGSLHLAFKYPELFGEVSSIAPSITTFEMERKEVIVPTFEDDADYFNANSPSTLVKANADYIRKNTTIRLLVGDKDFLYDLIQQFHQQLKDLQISHQYAIAGGADHDYKEVISKLDFNSFAFWGNAFEAFNAPVLSNLRLGFDKSDVEFIPWKLNEEFSPALLHYTATVEKSYTASMYITPELPSMTSGMITMNGNEVQSGAPCKVDLKLGDNIFKIKVTSQEGGSSNYTLTISQKDFSSVYVSELIAPGIWRISDFGGFIGNEDMYLVEGKDKALLFDTGMGTGDLAGYVRTLTKLPVDVAITHGNRDHFMQIDQFKESTVYLSKKDITRLPPQFITPKYMWLKEGDIIDIGAERRFEILEVPGHSLGCLIFLDARNKMAIVGDGVGSGDRVHMFGTACTALDQYLDGLIKAEDKIKYLDGLTLLVGHHYQEKTPLTGAAGKQLFTDMRILSEKVLRGEIVGKVAYTKRDGVTSEFRQAYYGLAGLWYNPKNLVTDPAALGDLAIQTSDGTTVITKPVFSSFQVNYTANVPESIKSVTILPTAYYSDHKSIVINGKTVRSGVMYKARLESGYNKFAIAVTARNDSTRNYTVIIAK